MKKRPTINLLLLSLLLSPAISLASTQKPTVHAQTESKSSTYNFMKDTYVNFGMGNSMPQSKIHTASISEDEPYTSKRLKNSYIYKISIGKRYKDFRAEVEFLHSHKHNMKFSIPYNDLSGATNMKQKYHTSHNTLFLNVIYDFQNLNKYIKPYIGVGMGLTRNKVSSMQTEVMYPTGSLAYKHPSKTNNSFAWNASIGLIAHANKNVYYDLSYKYFDLGKIKGSTKFTSLTGAEFTSPQSVKGHIRNHLILLGIGFKL